MKEITKYPLFGKAFLVKDDTGMFYEIGYQHPNGCGISFPAIGSGWSDAEVSIGNNTPVHIFSNGSEADSWLSFNCRKCKRCNDNITNPDDLRKDGGCSLELRIGLGAVGDGKIPFKAVKRIGYSSLTVQDSGLFANLGCCKEKI